MSQSRNTPDRSITITVKRGKVYYWCACGQSSSQPFCDGSHKGSTISPVYYQASETKELYLCGCKLTKTPPFCDGSHRNK